MTHSTISVILQRYVMNVDISENTCAIIVYIFDTLPHRGRKKKD